MLEKGYDSGLEESEEKCCMFDLIGDIHGYAAHLEALLRKLGYVNRHGVWSHSERKVIFLGDFIDRGKGERVLTPDHFVWVS